MLVYLGEGVGGEGGRGGRTKYVPWRQRNAWVEFVVGSLPCSESSFSGNPVLPSS